MYYLYENWRARGHRVIIHQGCCSFCNFGKGLSTGTRRNNGKWHGPYSDLDAAKAKASQINKEFKLCYFCLSNLKL